MCLGVEIYLVSYMAQTCKAFVLLSSFFGGTDEEAGMGVGSFRELKLPSNAAKWFVKGGSLRGGLNVGPF